MQSRKDLDLEAIESIRDTLGDNLNKVLDELTLTITATGFMDTVRENKHEENHIISFGANHENIKAVEFLSKNGIPGRKVSFYTDTDDVTDDRESHPYEKGILTHMVLSNHSMYPQEIQQTIIARKPFIWQTEDDCESADIFMLLDEDDEYKKYHGWNDEEWMEIQIHTEKSALGMNTTSLYDIDGNLSRLEINLLNECSSIVKIQGSVKSDMLKLGKASSTHISEDDIRNLNLVHANNIIPNDDGNYLFGVEFLGTNFIRTVRRSLPFRGLEEEAKEVVRRIAYGIGTY